MADKKNCRQGKEFENWAQTIKFTPDTYCQPEDEPSVREIINTAVAAHRHVRVQGNGHSWSQFVQTSDSLLWLKEMGLKDLPAAIRVDAAAKTATVPAGIRIRDLIRELRKDKYKLGLKNTGSILKQSIAGAISTGTHGTGIGLGNLATHIIGMKLLTMRNGALTELTLHEGDEFLDAARVSVGALGIITEVTIQCRADYRVELKGYRTSFHDISVQQFIDNLNQNNERVRLWWGGAFADRDDVIVTTMNETQNPQNSSIFDVIREFLDALFQGSQANPVVLTGHYSDLLTVPLLDVKHRECEYAIPVENTADALNAIKRMMDEGDFSTTLPIEVRFVKSDDSFLSPSYKKDVCYIGINTQAHNTEPSSNELYARFEPMMKDLGGRPHWGKHFTLTPQDLNAMYPRYDRFKEIRRELDPHNVFSNTLINYLF